MDICSESKRYTDHMRSCKTILDKMKLLLNFTELPNDIILKTHDSLKELNKITNDLLLLKGENNKLVEIYGTNETSKNAIENKNTKPNWESDSLPYNASFISLALSANELDAAESKISNICDNPSLPYEEKHKILRSVFLKEKIDNLKIDNTSTCFSPLCWTRNLNYNKNESRISNESIPKPIPKKKYTFGPTNFITMHAHSSSKKDDFYDDDDDDSDYEDVPENNLKNVSVNTKRIKYRQMSKKPVDKIKSSDSQGPYEVSVESLPFELVEYEESQKHFVAKNFPRKIKEFTRSSISKIFDRADKRKCDSACPYQSSMSSLTINFENKHRNLQEEKESVESIQSDDVSNEEVQAENIKIKAEILKSQEDIDKINSEKNGNNCENKKCLPNKEKSKKREEPERRTIQEYENDEVPQNDDSFKSTKCIRRAKIKSCDRPKSLQLQIEEKISNENMDENIYEEPKIETSVVDPRKLSVKDKTKICCRSKSLKVQIDEKVLEENIDENKEIIKEKKISDVSTKQPGKCPVDDSSKCTKRDKIKPSDRPKSLQLQTDEKISEKNMNENTGDSSKCTMCIRRDKIKPYDRPKSLQPQTDEKISEKNMDENTDDSSKFTMCIRRDKIKPCDRPKSLQPQTDEKISEKNTDENIDDSSKCKICMKRDKMKLCDRPKSLQLQIEEKLSKENMDENIYEELKIETSVVDPRKSSVKDKTKICCKSKSIQVQIDEKISEKKMDENTDDSPKCTICIRRDKLKLCDGPKSLQLQIDEKISEKKMDENTDDSPKCTICIRRDKLKLCDGPKSLQLQIDEKISEKKMDENKEIINEKKISDVSTKQPGKCPVDDSNKCTECIKRDKIKQWDRPKSLQPQRDEETSQNNIDENVYEEPKIETPIVDLKKASITDKIPIKSQNGKCPKSMLVDKETIENDKLPKEEMSVEEMIKARMKISVRYPGRINNCRDMKILNNNTAIRDTQIEENLTENGEIVDQLNKLPAGLKIYDGRLRKCSSGKKTKKREKLKSQVHKDETASVGEIKETHKSCVKYSKETKNPTEYEEIIGDEILNEDKIMTDETKETDVEEFEDARKKTKYQKDLEWVCEGYTKRHRISNRSSTLETVEEYMKIIDNETVENDKIAEEKMTSEEKAVTEEEMSAEETINTFIRYPQRIECPYKKSVKKKSKKRDKLKTQAAQIDEEIINEELPENEEIFEEKKDMETSAEGIKDAQKKCPCEKCKQRELTISEESVVEESKQTDTESVKRRSTGSNTNPLPLLQEESTNTLEDMKITDMHAWALAYVKLEDNGAKLVQILHTTQYEPGRYLFKEPNELILFGPQAGGGKQGN